MMYFKSPCLFCATLVVIGVAVRDEKCRRKSIEQLPCLLGECSKCTRCSECDGLKCQWVTNILKIDPSQGRYAGSFKDDKWGALTPNENKKIADDNLQAQSKLEQTIAEAGLRFGVKVGGFCETKDEIKNRNLQETHYVSSGCKQLQTQIEADLNSFDNQHTTVQGRIRAKDQENALGKLRIQAFVKSFKEAAACDESVSTTIQQAVKECHENPNKDAEFFQKVYCVKVEDLRRHALLDSPFDDKHGVEEDQKYVEDLKDIDPFTWHNNGHPDPIHMFISSEQKYMIAVIDSGRHRATAMVQRGGTDLKVPVNFDCRCPCDSTNSSLLESEKVREEIKGFRPNNMIPLSCYEHRASKNRYKDNGC